MLFKQDEMFSKTCEYAIKAMIFVASTATEQQRIGVKEIAKNIDAPEHFTAKILQELGRKKLLHSMKGPNGGFYLTEKDKKTSLADIVRAFDGEKIYDLCVLGLKVCSAKNPCPVHFEYVEIKKNLIKMIENNTIAGFNEKLDNGKFFLKNH